MRRLAAKRHLLIMNGMNKDIRTYNICDLEALVTSLGQPKFRAKQLVNWLYIQGVNSYDEMGNLPKALKQQLSVAAPLEPLQVIDKQISRDGTRKYVIQFSDGACVETVGIPSLDTKGSSDEPKHLTVCFSTQAGCAMGCIFCATGQEGLQRNLSSGEMVSQILTVQQDFGTRVSNVVSMGQGEPFMNYDAVMDALRFLNNSQTGFGIGARHITISTCGLIQGIERLSNEPEQFTLAVSLHAARQEVRDRLMPRCSNISVQKIKNSLVAYAERTGRRVSLEYLLSKGINDKEDDLRALESFCEGLLCHVNLIPLNFVEGSPLKPSEPSVEKHWVQELKKQGTECTVRNSRGSDIDGACGQLKNKLKSNPRSK